MAKKLKQIKTLADLHKAALARKSVCEETGWGVIPAAVLMHMQGHTILRRILGGLFIYEKYSGPFAGSPWKRKRAGKVVDADFKS